MSMKKSSVMQTSSSSNKFGFEQEQLDPYSTSAVENLLQGSSEWKNIQDIIRLTLQTLTDVVRAQGQTLSQLERQMPTRASKTQLNTGLSLKSNISDVSRSIAELASGLDSQISYQDLQLVLKDFTTRNDVQYQLSSKVTIDEVKSLLETKATSSDLKSETETIYKQLHEFKEEYIRKLATFVDIKEFERLNEQIDSKAGLNEVKEALDLKANKQSVSNALHRKANRSEIEELLAKKANADDLHNLIGSLGQFQQIYNILQSKVDADGVVKALNSKVQQSVLDQFINQVESSFENQSKLVKAELLQLSQQVKRELESRGEKKQIEELNEIMNSKVEYNDLNEIVVNLKEEIYQDMQTIKEEVLTNSIIGNRTDRERGEKTSEIIEKLTEEVIKISDELKIIREQKDVHTEETGKMIQNITRSLKSDLNKETEKTYEMIENLQKTVEDWVNQKLDQRDLQDLQSQLLSKLDEKVDLNEIQSALNASQADISSRFVEYKEEVRAALQTLDNQIVNGLNQQANTNQILTILSGQADLSVIQTFVQQKLELNDFELVQSNVQQIITLMNQKLDFKEFQDFLNNFQSTTQHLQRQSILKANIKDVCSLLDNQAGIQDINKALSEIHQELDEKSNIQDLNTFIGDQGMIIEMLMTENFIARWTWKSGELKSGSLVPWEYEIVNTLQETFLWEKEQTNIQVVGAGLYEISVGIFAQQQPNIQLLVNGEPVISSINNSNQIVYPNNSKLKEQGKHPSGIVTGVSIIDYLILPSKARLSILYEGELGGEGFLGLQRLRANQ